MYTLMRNFHSLSPRALAVVLALALIPLFSGCVVVAAGAAGAGAVAYARGQLTSDLTHGLDDVYAASQRAIAQLEFARIEERKSSIDARLLARTASDKKIAINLERVGNHLTKVKIRVDTFGDQSLSLLVLEKINAELK